MRNLATQTYHEISFASILIKAAFYAKLKIIASFLWGKWRVLQLQFSDKYKVYEY